MIEQWQTEKHRAFENFRDNKLDDAIANYKKAVGSAEKLGCGDPRLPLTLNELARAYAAKEDYADAAATYKTAVGLLESMQEKTGSSKSSTDIATGVIDALEGLANASQKLHNMHEADLYYRRALNVLRIENEPTRKRDIVYEYRSFLLSQSRTKEAEQLARAMGSVSAESPLPDVQQNFHEQFDKAIHDSEEHLKQQNIVASIGDCVHAVRFAQLMRNAEKLADAETRLGSLFALQGRNDQAERVFQIATRHYDLIKADDARRFNCLVGYTRVLISLSKTAQAEAIGSRALAVAERHDSPDHHELIETLGSMGMVYSQQKNWGKALAVQNRAYDLIRKTSPIDNPQVIMASCYTVSRYCSAKRNSDARRFLDRYVADLKKQKGSEIVLPARLFNDYGIACIKDKHEDIASWFFSASLDLLKRAPGEHDEIARAQQQLKIAKAHS